ncbi:hypothetical protein [Nostoc sp. TCL26-01]|uniref:hypothetical protein n=1 Tax=Nostoc sp. TCL26-01 TaxID=2576904 RepID=UPI0015BB7F66|nr:hypothetical protein [Nostoc sp. TCL26-01]QLE56760.1 hypothetical protein FD725_15350 [Nostoc sp. TCL26-01]
MVFLKGKKTAGISNSLLTNDVDISNIDFSSSNFSRLKSIIAFFSYLNMNGEISDEAFTSLVRYACSIFVENEIESRVNFTFEKKIISLFQTKLYAAINQYIASK